MRISDWSSDVCSSDLRPRDGDRIPRDFRPVRTGGRRPNLGPGAYRRDGDLMAGLIPAVRRMVFALLLPCLVLATPAAADAPLRESFDLRVRVATVALPIDEFERALGWKRSGPICMLC